MLKSTAGALSAMGAGELGASGGGSTMCIKCSHPLVRTRMGQGAALPPLCAAMATASVREREGEEGDDAVGVGFQSNGWHATASAKRCASVDRSMEIQRSTARAPAPVLLVGWAESSDSSPSRTRAQ